MKEIFVKNKMIVFDCLCLVSAILLASIGLIDITLALLIIASIVLVKIIKDMTQNYITFSVLFVIFHVAYGLFGVVSKYWFNQLSATYGNSFIYSPYLILYGLCTLALLVGVILANYKYRDNIKIKDQKEVIDKTEDMKFNKYFLFVAYCGFALASIFEIINFARVGGLPTLMSGKAIYQAAVDELVLTLPTQYIFQMALASFALYMIIGKTNDKKIKIRTFIIAFILSAPYLAMIFLLVRRGIILAIGLILLVALFYIKPLKRLNLKFVIILIIAYLLVGFLYSVRDDIGVIFTDFDKFKEEFNLNRVIRNLNPAMSEFGCTYGNFNKFYIIDDHNWLYGKSYIEGLVHFIPSYLYVGEKPQMITYTFRDKYFPQKSEISSIASTGFSSMLEAYWNFGYLGSIIYVLYGYLIVFLDKRIKTKNYFCMLFSLSIIPIVYVFHRSDFGHVFSELIMAVFEIVFIYFFYKKIYCKDKKLAIIVDKICE